MIRRLKMMLTLIVTLSASPHIAYAADPSIDIKGLPEELAVNLEYYIDSIGEPVAFKFSNAKWHSIVSEALTPLGFYNFQMTLEMKDDDKLVLNIDPGTPMLIAESDIVIVGDARSDPEFIEAVKEAPLKVGQPLKHKTYDDLKSHLRNMAIRKGYFDSQFTESRLEVSPKHNQAFVRLHFDSGPRYRFGATTIVHSQIELSRLASLKTFKQGDEFDTNVLGDYQIQLSETGWFGSVLVSPELEAHLDDKEIPIKVVLEPRSKNVVQAGGGYSTDIGVKGSLRWSQPWYNDRGHSFDSQLELSGSEQSLELGYKIPTLDVFYDYYSIKFGIEHVDYLDTQSFSTDLAFEKHWLLSDLWESNLFIKYLYEDFTQGVDNNNTQLFMPGFSFSYTNSRNRNKIQQVREQEKSRAIQHRHLLSVEYGEPYLLSDIRLLRLQTDSNMSWHFYPKHKIHLRGNLGINITSDLTKVPSTLRYFAGGDNSVRGYDYESISPVDESGNLTGARYRITGGIDYQYNFWKTFWIGTFLDLGDAFNDQLDLKTGTGLSLEWASPIVPIKLDFAWGLDAAPTEDNFQIHLSMGVQF